MGVFATVDSPRRHRAFRLSVSCSVFSRCISSQTSPDKARASVPLNARRPPHFVLHVFLSFGCRFRGVKGIRICLEMPFLSRKGFCFTRLYGNRYLLVSLVPELGVKRRKTGGLQELPRCSLARLGGEKVGRRLASLALYTLHSGAVLRGSVQRVLSFHRQPSRLASKQSTSRIETPTSSLGASPSDRKGSQLDHSPLLQAVLTAALVLVTYRLTPTHPRP